MADSIKCLGTGKNRGLFIRKVTTDETLDIGSSENSSDVDFWVELDTESTVFTFSQEDLPQLIEFLQSKLEKTTDE